MLKSKVNQPQTHDVHIDKIVRTKNMHSYVRMLHTVRVTLYVRKFEELITLTNNVTVAIYVQ